MVSVNGELLCDFVMDWLMEMVKWLVVVRVMERVGSWVGSQVPRESMTNCYTCCEPQKKLETILKTRKWRFLTTSGLFGKRLHWIAWDCLALDWIGLEPRGMFLSRRYPQDSYVDSWQRWKGQNERVNASNGTRGAHAGGNGSLCAAAAGNAATRDVLTRPLTHSHTDTHWHTHTHTGRPQKTPTIPLLADSRNNRH